ncbi:MAG: hypothetical protein Q8P20_08530 [bacterium]|nr:hypothetical protein [bacterium]
MTEQPYYMIVVFVNNPKKGQVMVLKKHLHISIKRRFSLKEISEDQMIKEIGDIIFDFKNKKLMLGQISEFSNGQKYYSIQPRITVSQIHKKLINKLNKFANTKDKRWEDENFIPHLAIYDFNKVKYPIFIKIDYLFLIKEIDAENDKWKIIEKI